MSGVWNPHALMGTHLGSCILEQPLGIGGMGAVYLARQVRPHRQVAVKVLRPQLTTDPRALRVFLERFRREADATAVLDHANIVPLYEFGEEGDVAYLVMPYLADGSLAALLAREHTLPLPRVLTYVEQAAAALDHAHRHGIVHRDVKPSNLLLHPDGRLLLADFGIARVMTGDSSLLDGPAADVFAPAADLTLTQTGMAMGTPEYMAPEQVQGGPVGAASDIYALGIVTYVMLAGKTPFNAGDVSSVLTRQLIDPPLPLRALRPDVPAAVEEAIFWSLAKDARERPSSAGELAHALADAARNRRLFRNWTWTRNIPAPLREDLPTTPDASQPTVALSARARSRTRSLSFGVRGHGAFHLAPGDAPSDQLIQGMSGPPVRPDAPTVSLSATNMSARASADPSATTASGDGAGWRAGTPTGAPAWPIAPRPRPTTPRPRRFVLVALAAALVFALGITAILGGLLAPGWSPFNSGGQPLARVTRTPAPSPTATRTPMPTATVTPAPPANWLSVTPESVSLTCKGSRKSAVVTLQNDGLQSLTWTTTIPRTAGFADVLVSPSSGSLSAGTSTSITIANRGLPFPRNGSIQIAAKNASAGQPASVAFTASACAG